MARQVRLDDDVADALERLAARVDGDHPRSLAFHANRKLRQVLRLDVDGAAAVGPPGRLRANARVSGAPKGRKPPQGRRRPVL